MFGIGFVCPSLYFLQTVMLEYTEHGTFITVYLMILACPWCI